jgi:hypothetical protein
MNCNPPTVIDFNKIEFPKPTINDTLKDISSMSAYSLKGISSLNNYYSNINNDNVKIGSQYQTIEKLNVNDIIPDYARIDAILDKKTYLLEKGSPIDGEFSSDRFRNALKEASIEYPQYKDVFDNLKVVNSNQDMVALERPDGHLSIYVRGTNLSNIRDITNDAQILIGIQPNRLETLNNFIEETKTMCNSPAEIHLSGHSLGGTLTNEYSKNNACSTSTTFNAANVSWFNAGKYTQIKKILRMENLVWEMEI